MSLSPELLCCVSSSVPTTSTSTSSPKVCRIPVGLVCCYCSVTSVTSNSVRPHRWQPTRFCRPWDSPGKNTGVDCHCLLHCVKVKSETEVAQSSLTLCDPWTTACQASLSITNSWYLLKLMSTELVMPSNHLILCHPILLPSIFPASGSFQMSQFFASGGQSIGVSASVSVLPMNIQDNLFIHCFSD